MTSLDMDSPPVRSQKNALSPIASLGRLLEANPPWMEMVGNAARG